MSPHTGCFAVLTFPSVYHLHAWQQLAVFRNRAQCLHLRAPALECLGDRIASRKDRPDLGQTINYMMELKDPKQHQYLQRRREYKDIPAPWCMLREVKMRRREVSVALLWLIAAFMCMSSCSSFRRLLAELSSGSKRLLLLPDGHATAATAAFSASASVSSMPLHRAPKYSTTRICKISKCQWMNWMSGLPL